MVKRRDKTTPPFPTRDQLLAFISEAGGKVDRREIANAFHIRGDGRARLREMLRELDQEGTDRASRGKRPTGTLPPVIIVEITGLTPDGEPLARPADWNDRRKEPPRIVITDSARGQVPGIGQRALVKLQPVEAHHYTALIIRALPEKRAERILAVYKAGRDGGILEPVSRKVKDSFSVELTEAENAQPGDLVLARIISRARNQRLGLQRAKVEEIIGQIDSPQSYSLIAIHHQDIPVEFSDAAIAEAEASEDPVLGNRTDLRDIPLVTIDGPDARDFDDAVFAESEGDGWHCIVAIADVAHYVQTDSALDKDALNRGNSVYFPDRVVPMLPEKLSNGLCSLNPDVDRYCLAVHLWLDADGETTRYQFVRGLMRSRHRLTYERAQALYNGQDAGFQDVLIPLYGAYRSLLKYRDRRGALDLDLPEYKIALGSDGEVAEVLRRQRLDSHKLIEELMICANVAAADAIEKHRLSGIFRVHEEPAPLKIDDLREFLSSLGFSLSQNANAKQFNQLLRQVADTSSAPMISNAVLRSQMQAYYSPANLGHFGLGLDRYAHFTSPIRRYADLMVHRALVGMLDASLAESVEKSKLTAISDHISDTERRAMLAEREANDRYITAYMADHVDAEFEAFVTSVGSFGLFVTLTETGASGLVRMGDLGRDFYVYHEKIHSLIGRETGHRYQLGQRLVVKLTDADTQTGSLRFRIVSADTLAPLTVDPRPPGNTGFRRKRGQADRRGDKSKERKHGTANKPKGKGKRKR